MLSSRQALVVPVTYIKSRIISIYVFAKYSPLKRMTIQEVLHYLHKGRFLHSTKMIIIMIISDIIYMLNNLFRTERKKQEAERRYILVDQSFLVAMPILFMGDI